MFVIKQVDDDMNYQEEFSTHGKKPNLDLITSLCKVLILARERVEQEPSSPAEEYAHNKDIEVVSNFLDSYVNSNVALAKDRGNK